MCYEYTLLSQTKLGVLVQQGKWLLQHVIKLKAHTFPKVALEHARKTHNSGANPGPRVYAI